MGGGLAMLIAAAFAFGGGVLGGLLAGSSALPEDPLARTIVVQSAMLGCVRLGIGAGLGLAVSVPAIRPRLLATCISGGMLGGLLAGLIFPLASSVLLPNARTEVLMPDAGVSRLLWFALVSGASVLVLTGMGKEKKTGEQGSLTHGIRWCMVSAAVAPRSFLATFSRESEDVGILLSRGAIGGSKQAAPLQSPSALVCPLPLREKGECCKSLIDQNQSQDLHDRHRLVLIRKAGTAA